MVLEEGKLNLILRCLREYKVTQRNLLSQPEFRTSLLAKVGKDEGEIGGAEIIFEAGLGTILNLCLQAIESLQTLDLPLLVQHSAEVMAYAQDPGPQPQLEAAMAEHPGLLQEDRIPLYIRALLANLDHINEDRTLELIEHHGILTGLASHILHYAPSGALSPAAASAGLEALSRIVETDAFTTHPEAFLPSTQAEDVLLAVVNDVVPVIEPLAPSPLRIQPLRILVHDW